MKRNVHNFARAVCAWPDYMRYAGLAWFISICIKCQTLLILASYVGPCKVIQESLGFRIPRCGFQIPCPRIPDSTFVDSGFHSPKVAGFQILVSNVFFVLCFPNKMTLITDLLLKGKMKDHFSFLTRKVARCLWNIISIIYRASRVIKYTSLPYLWRLWIRVFSEVHWFHIFEQILTR